MNCPDKEGYKELSEKIEILEKKGDSQLVWKTPTMHVLPGT